MKKIFIIFFMMLVSIPAFSLEFDPATDKCLREILNKQEGEEIDFSYELDNIKEFNCYSTEVTIESLKKLAYYVQDETIFSIGQEGEKGFTEGMFILCKPIPGHITEDGRIMPGLWGDGDTFIPGLVDLEKGAFLPGVYFEGVYTSGIILDGEFLAGLFNVEKKSFAQGLLEVGKDGNVNFKSGNFRNNFKNLNNSLKGKKGFGFSRDDLMSLAGPNNAGLGDNSGKIGQRGLFLSDKEKADIRKQGDEIFNNWMKKGIVLGVFLPEAYMAIGAGIVLGTELAIPVLEIIEFMTEEEVQYTGSYTEEEQKALGEEWEKMKALEEEEKRKKEEAEKKKKEEDKNEKEKDENDDSTKCEDPDAEPQGDSSNEDDEDKQDSIINTGGEGAGKVNLKDKKVNSKLTQDSIWNTGIEGIDTGIIIDGKIDQSVIINTGNPNIETN